MKNIKDGREASVIFLLRTQGKERGYSGDWKEVPGDPLVPGDAVNGPTINNDNRQVNVTVNVIGDDEALKVLKILKDTGALDLALEESKPVIVNGADNG